MKLKWISALLLLAILFGTVSCTAIPPKKAEPAEANPNFISANPETLSKESSEAFLNLAATDAQDEPIFQIVYNIKASQRIEEGCSTLAADIYDTTGVLVPIVHSSEPQKAFEITVGDVKRSETLATVDSFDLGPDDFAICAVGTRILIYAETDTAVVSGLIFFMEQVAKKSLLQKTYGVAESYRYIYQTFDIPKASVEGITDDRYLNLKLENGPSMFTYARLSYTGNSGWRIQTKEKAADTYRVDGAAQLLSYSMGEHILGTEDDRFYTEPITSSRVGETYIATAPDSSRVEINLSTFRMDFYTPTGKLASTVKELTTTSVTGVLEGGEAVFGTGERMNSVNQRGKRIELFSYDAWSMAEACYMVIPLLCFSRGSGIFLNSYEHMVLDLDAAHPLNHSAPGEWKAVMTGAPIDCYIYTTEHISNVIENYSRLSGYASLPEEWTYGMLVCAYTPDLSQKWSADITPSVEDGRGEGVYEMIANMEANDLPWTGIIAEGWHPYNPSTHKDLKELCDYVHSLGKKFMVYMRVGEPWKSMEGYSTDYLLTQTRADGKKSYNLPDTTTTSNNPDIGNTTEHTYIDVTHPKAIHWFFNEYWDDLSNEIGVGGCKIDFCETLPENLKLNYFDRQIPTAGSHHWYPTAFCTMFYNMISQKPDGGMCYTRGGGIGAQRAPFMWAGDQHRFWSGIQYQLKATLSSGMSGVPYMSYDMGGYQYGNDPARKEIGYESELFLRATTFSAFTVCIQTHGKVRRAYQFAEYTDGHGNHPYAYVTDIYRAYTKLHEHLTPYLTELCEEASSTGMPPVRHLVLTWQNDANVYNIDSQYTLGDAFLIAPILDGNDTREVYLPKGTWEDLNTGTVYEVGSEGMTLNVTATLAELPSFFNTETESDTARELVDGIKELYSYAKGMEP